MTRFKLFEGELYPMYKLTEEKMEFYHTGEFVELTEQEHYFIQRALIDFDIAQEILNSKRFKVKE